MQKKTRFHFTFVMLLVTSLAHAETLQPTLESPAEMRLRREAIYEELDRNVEAVKQCFEILDETPDDEAGSRQFLDTQIQQYDDRSSVLHEELAQIERHEFLADHKRELFDKVTRLEDEAKQLSKRGHAIPAGLRQAKAESIKRTLEDGSWKILADDEWSCEPKDTDLISVLQLNVEVENLKLETASLRQEVKELRALVRRLEGSILNKATGQ